LESTPFWQKYEHSMLSVHVLVPFTVVHVLLGSHLEESDPRHPLTEEATTTRHSVMATCPRGISHIGPISNCAPANIRIHRTPCSPATASVLRNPSLSLTV
jgi:hypothetical protein